MSVVAPGCQLVGRLEGDVNGIEHDIQAVPLRLPAAIDHIVEIGVDVISMSLGVTEALYGVSWMKLASSTPRASTHWLLAWSWLLLQGTRTTASTTQLSRLANKAAF
jgi:hypothetical protein